MGRRFTDGEIKAANNKNIIDYVSSMNLQPKKAGKSLKIDGYGGLYIDPIHNRWNCFSSNKGGGIIQLVMYLENKSWKDSVKSLINEDYTGILKPNRNNENKISEKFILPEINNAYNHMLAYLIKTRNIDKELVYKAIKDKKLFEDKNKNCVFVSYDNNNNTDYAVLRGTNQYIL